MHRRHVARCPLTDGDRASRRRRARAERKGDPVPPALSGADVDPRLTAGIALLERTGAREVQIRWHDMEQPVTWIAVGEWHVGADGAPTRRGEGVGVYFDAAAAMDPVRAVLRLCERMVDGGTCTHCHRPTGFEPDSIESMPYADTWCWWQYDPELKTFRRGCEGDAP